MSRPSNADTELLTIARRQLDIAMSTYSESRESELDDLRFYSASPDNQWQWPENVLGTRGAVQGQTIGARPCLTINKLPQHVRQVTNDQRQNRPSVKVIPVDDHADVEIAEIFNGIIRHIEYISDADVAYDTACENQVTYGEGYIRILTDYCDDDSFNQDIKIGRIRNSFSVYMDPMIQDPCGSDAKWCFITEELTKVEYERLYPNAALVSSLLDLGTGDETAYPWINDDCIRIAEWFYIDYSKQTLNLYPDNITTVDGSDDDELARLSYLKPLKQRVVYKEQVKWVKTNGYEILERGDWVGKHIPIVRIVGNEYEINGKIYLSGIVRNAKDAQRMYNYWTSQEAEMLALAPKAPFIAYGGQIEGYEHQWNTANTTNWPVLEVNPDVTDGQGNVLPLPQRALPPMAQTGLIQAKMGASDDIKATTGQYDASLGATSNERSGKAILARERQVDTGTYHYVDNQSRGVRHVGRQLVDIIPKIYDAERVARIIGLDGEVEMAHIDPSQEQPVQKITDDKGIVLKKIYNLLIGKYDVCVTTGPSYMTKRQESMEAMAQLIQSYPALMEVAGDLLVKGMDFPGSQEIAKRIAATIDPKIMENGDDSPEMQAAKQQMEQMGQEMDQMHQIIKNFGKSLEVQEEDRKDFEAQVKAFDAETKRLTAIQSSMSEEQIQQIVLGTIHSMVNTGDLMGRLGDELSEDLSEQESSEQESSEQESLEQQF